MPNNKIRSVASCLGWSLVAWFFMAAAAFGLQHDLKNQFDWCLLPLFATPLAAFCTAKATRRACGLPRIARLIFWMITISGATLVVLLFWVQTAALKNLELTHLLKNRENRIMLAVVVLFVIWLGIRAFRTKRTGKPAVRWLSDCAIGAVCLLILTACAFLAFSKIYIPYLGRKAEARWAAIGRPMPEFEKNLRTIEENESLRELARDLKPFGLGNIYKRREGEEDRNKIEFPKEYLDFSEAVKNSCSDQIDLPGKNLSAYLDGHKGDFDRLYQGILSREPAIWNFVLKDGFKLRVPNYLAARQLSQLIYADALCRLEHGDAKGAADAIAAGLKMTVNFNDQDILVSALIRVSIESLFARASARFPEDPDALKNLANDVKIKRGKWLELMQAECASYQYSINQYAGEYFGGDFCTLSPTQPLPRWLALRIWRAAMLRWTYKNWESVADQIEIIKKPQELVATDLGAKEMEAIDNRNPSIFSIGWSRAWLRLNLALLLREQSELIRWSRSKMQAGKSGVLGELASVVIPTSKWVITGDVAANSVSMKLTPAPVWTTENTVVENTFFLLPLDGSKSWKFAK